MGDNQSRNPSLDGIRGIAILLVLFHHVIVIQPTQNSEALAYLVVQAGWIGVDLFFVLSGFLITKVLIDSRSSRNYARNFYGRRALRILPVYFVTLFGFLIFYVGADAFNFVTFAPEPLHQALTDLPWHFFFLSNFLILVKGHFLASLNHFWTLAVEEQFYLLWPLVVFLTPPKRLPLVCLLTIVLAIILRQVLLNQGMSGPVLASFTLARMDSFAVGGLLASVLGSKPPQSWVRYFSIPIFFLFFGLSLHLAWQQGSFYSTDAGIQKWGYTFLALMFGALVAYGYSLSPGSWSAKILGCRFLRFFGQISFALYVVHFPVQAFLEIAWPTGEAGIWLHSGISIGISVLIATVSWYALEKPLLAYKRRWT